MVSRATYLVVDQSHFTVDSTLYLFTTISYISTRKLDHSFKRRTHCIPLPSSESSQTWRIVFRDLLVFYKNVHVTGLLPPPPHLDYWELFACDPTEAYAKICANWVVGVLEVDMRPTCLRVLSYSLSGG